MSGIMSGNMSEKCPECPVNTCRFNATELGRRSTLTLTLTTAAAAPMASVCSPHTGPQFRLGSKDASAASASSAPSSICREDPLGATRGCARRGTTDGHGLFSVLLKKGKSFFLNTRFPAELSSMTSSMRSVIEKALRLRLVPWLPSASSTR